MDPLATLIYIVEHCQFDNTAFDGAFADVDMVALAERIAAYQGWRARGGFRPLISQDLAAWPLLARYADLHGISCEADSIVERAAQVLRANLRERTSRDFGARFTVEMLDTIENALEG